METDLCVCRLVFVHRPKVLSDYVEVQKARPAPRLLLDPECLRWTPVITRASLDEEFELAENDVSGYPPFVSSLVSCLVWETEKVPCTSSGWLLTVCVWSLAVLSPFLAGPHCYLLWACAGVVRQWNLLQTTGLGCCSLQNYCFTKLLLSSITVFLL